MSPIESRLNEIDFLYKMQQRDLWMNKLHPLVKLLLCVFYIAVCVSIGGYELGKMLLMAVYILVSYNLAEFDIRDAIWRIKLILPLVMAVGIFNPLLDKNVWFMVGGIKVSAGWISLLTLMLKGVYSVMSAYLLIVTTSIEEICAALSIIKVPKLMITVLLLIYRYILILGEEADRIMTSYHLRAPAQKGINYKVWGPLVGQWLLRSFDKAEKVYESMLLRGFSGNFAVNKKYEAASKSVMYFALWAVVLLLFRFNPFI